MTFKRVEPPPASPVVPPPAPVLTPAELARQQELEAKISAVLSVSASVGPTGVTVLRWSCDGSPVLHAVSNVDFRLLAGQGMVETASSVYPLILAAGEDPDPPSPETALAARHLPADGRPWFVLLDWQRERTAAEEAAVAAMAALHDHFTVHKAELTALHARRQAEAAARTAPPPPQPQHRVIHFWPLQPAQRAALEAGTGTATAAAAQPQPQPQQP